MGACCFDKKERKLGKLNGWRKWEDNPGSSRGSFDLPLIFPNSFAHKRIGLRGSVGTSVYSFPWIGSELTELDIFSLAKAEERSAEGFHRTKVMTKSTSSAIKIGWRFWCNKSVLLGLADYSGGKETGEGGNRREREKQGRRGSERYSSESSKARQIQWRNPPSSQMNITTSLPPSCFTRLHRCFFPPPPFLAPL
ncbi:hypothetical protein NQZ68_004742 [Dissostichus eleginoides]|nr:hypothetical protein NQZ68_004742 [Dissostichus eleginoides]